MAYNFLGLTNKILNKTNDVELTSSTFATADGFYAEAKNAVNYAIRDINQIEFEWPFNFTEQDDTLVAGTVRYNYPADAKRINMDSFRIQRDATFGNETKSLRVLDYEEYLRKYVDYEYNTSDTGIRQLPERVFQSPNREYGVVPPPDQAYTITYDYYKVPTSLSAYDDVPTIPSQFEHVIVNGAMYHVYMFRREPEAAMAQKQLFDENIKNMRKNYINRHEYVRDTRVPERNWISTFRVN